MCRASWVTGESRASQRCGHSHCSAPACHDQTVDVTTGAQGAFISTSPNFRHIATLAGKRVFVEHLGTPPAGVPFGEPEIVNGRLVDANFYAENMVEAEDEIFAFDALDIEGDLSSFDGVRTRDVARFKARISHAASTKEEYLVVANAVGGKNAIHRIAKQGSGTTSILAPSLEKKEIGRDLAVAQGNAYFTYGQGLGKPETLASAPLAGGGSRRLAGPMGAAFLYPHAAGNALYVHVLRVGGIAGTCLYKWDEAAQHLNAIAANTCAQGCNDVVFDDARKLTSL